MLEIIKAILKVDFAEIGKIKSLVKKARKRRKFWVELILTLVVIGLYLITYQLVGKLLK